MEWAGKPDLRVAGFLIEQEAAEGMQDAGSPTDRPDHVCLSSVLRSRMMRGVLTLTMATVLLVPVAAGDASARRLDGDIESLLLFSALGGGELDVRDLLLLNALGRQSVRVDADLDFDFDRDDAILLAALSGGRLEVHDLLFLETFSDSNVDIGDLIFLNAFGRRVGVSGLDTDDLLLLDLLGDRRFSFDAFASRSIFTGRSLFDRGLFDDDDEGLFDDDDGFFDDDDSIFGDRHRTLTGEIFDRSIRNARIHEALVRGSDLRDVRVSEATLEDSDVEDAEVNAATLRDSDIRDAELDSVLIEGGSVVDSKLDAVTIRDAALDDVDISDALIEGGSIRDGRLVDTTLRDVDLGSGVEVCRVLIEETGEHLNDDC